MEEDEEVKEEHHTLEGGREENWRSWLIMVALASGVLIQVGRLSAPSSSPRLTSLSLSVCDGCLGRPSDMGNVSGVIAYQHYYCYLVFVVCLIAKVE